ncbi:hypothetical protein A2W24_04535 [Microgenomates group bacterium RBG_16_45_19]|nr:MAG: hypothetical protein A2W24_04535 [Microgenomates group bacterium RBG_16_45_19]
MKPIEPIFEDRWLWVINKPAGVVVNRAQSVKQATIQDWAENSHKLQVTSDKIFLQRGGVAHRLDKDTSGCLLIAKDPETLDRLLKLFKLRQIKKDYLALVHGQVKPAKGWWSWPINRGRGKKRREFRVTPQGKSAFSRYQVQERYRYQGESYSLLSVDLETGRTHQIRVHAAFAKHPVVADEIYGIAAVSQADRVWCGRHWLHAARISLTHPITGAALTVKAALPQDLEAALKRLQRQA